MRDIFVYFFIIKEKIYVGGYLKKVGILIFILFVFVSMIPCKTIYAIFGIENTAYYLKKFNEVTKEMTEEHKDDDGKKIGPLEQMVNDLYKKVLNISNKTTSDEFRTYMKLYNKVNSVYKECSHDFRQTSYDYKAWKEERIDPKNENSETNKDKYAAEIVNIDKTRDDIGSKLDDYKKKMEEIFSVLSKKMSAVIQTSNILDLVANFCVIGGSVWIILGTITLAGSLKDKNGPTLQTSIWQIVGGTMIVFATYLFRNISEYPNLLNEVLSLAAQFTRVGGALWSVWGIIILAGALKDKTGPALQSAIWQIVGGIMIMMTSYLFTSVVKIV